jgi:hypothetical protein
MDTLGLKLAVAGVQLPSVALGCVILSSTKDMLHSTLSLFNVHWRRLLERQIVAAEAAAHKVDVSDNLARLLAPPVPVSYIANRDQEIDFVKWRSPTYVEPMSDGVVDETVAALLGRNVPEAFDASTLARMALYCPSAYLIKKEGDVYVLDLAALSLFPYRPLTISQFRFNLERSEFAIIDISGRLHKPEDTSWETALAHAMCWMTIANPAGAHNWVHFALPDAAASVHDRMTQRDTTLWRLLAPHLRFTNRINYQALWIQRSSDNAPTFRKALVPWLSMPFYPDQFRGGILRNTQRHYSALPRHFDLPSSLDPEVPYFRFLNDYYAVVERFAAAIDPELEQGAWDEFARGVDAELPGFMRIPRVKALAVLIWQVGVVHICDHLTYFEFGMRYGFMRVPRSLKTPYTRKDVGRWDRWKTRNFMKTFVTFNPNPNLDQRLLNIGAYGFAPASAAGKAAARFKQDLLALDAQLAAEGRALVPVDRMVQSVCF